MQKTGTDAFSSISSGTDITLTSFPTYVTKQLTSPTLAYTVQQVYTSSNLDIQFQSPYNLISSDILTVTLPLPNPLNSNLKLISADSSVTCDSTALTLPAKATCAATLSSGTLKVTSFVPGTGVTAGTVIKVTFPSVMTPLSTSSLVD